MPDAKDLLAGRSDLSTFLVHFTRAQADGTSAREVLQKILNGQVLKASRVHGIGKALLEERTAPQEVLDQLSVVCMSEAPMAHWSMFCSEIPGRSWRFAPYGLVFTKDWARGYGFNPVWYLNTVPGHAWLTTPLNELAEIASNGKARARDGNGKLKDVRFRDSQIARILPFIETAGVGKDFSWEREWRRVGSVSFLPPEAVAVLVPDEDHPAFQDEYDRRCESSGRPTTTLNLVDPTWPLTRIQGAVSR